ncbi:MAG: type I-E CRISPR-associated protein Cse2/CasB [Pyrinomonadaceae bacterium MAG19_C2-C3]|nr:type I-E CRISPR-associated protein Cse2/CasB [Pyrinomonadaceae bacterium MAG19_C2-C3]
MNSTSTAPPKPEPSAFNERRRRFIGNLRLLEEHDDGPSRAGLAALRAGLRTKNGIAIEMMPHVVPYLDEREHTNDCWFFAIAALFAAHPLTTKENISLGGSFGRLREKSGSIEKRFQLLLASDEEDLFERLKKIVSLLKAHNVPVNWYALLRDLTTRSWDDPQRHLQLDWARDFYRSAPIKSTPNAS